MIRLNYLKKDEKSSRNKLFKFIFQFAIIGAGFAGLLVGHFFKLMGLKFVIYEKGSDVGGTWFWNTYPGVACDVASYQYSYSHFLSADWTHTFPGIGKKSFRYLVINENLNKSLSS